MDERPMKDNMKLATTLYVEQKQNWPEQGCHILGQFTEDTIVVYQAFPKAIAAFAVTQGYLGGNFRLERMSWIKPNFLWMMYRSGWATKVDQEHVLAIHLQRTGFEELLRQAVHSHYVPTLYETELQWRQAVAESAVRLQWDPDHDPFGRSLPRRAIQLGLRGQILLQYAQQWILSIEDITDFVHAQQQFVQSGHLDRLLTPVERIYPISDVALQKRLGIFSG